MFEKLVTSGLVLTIGFGQVGGVQFLKSTLLPNNKPPSREEEEHNHKETPLGHPGTFHIPLVTNIGSNTAEQGVYRAIDMRAVARMLRDQQTQDHTA